MNNYVSSIVLFHTTIPADMQFLSGIHTLFCTVSILSADSGSQVKTVLFYPHAGLCLIEVVSGTPVFDDIENDKRVFYTKISGEKPRIPVS